MNTPTHTPAPRKHAGNEEPELGADESIPLDGKDTEGEEMMKELGRDLSKRNANASGRNNDSDERPEQGIARENLP